MTSIEENSWHEPQSPPEVTLLHLSETERARAEAQFIEGCKEIASSATLNEPDTKRPVLGERLKDIRQSVMPVCQPKQVCRDLSDSTFACMHRLPKITQKEIFELSSDFPKLSEDNTEVHSDRTKLPVNITYQEFALQWSTVVEDEIVNHCGHLDVNRDIISKVLGGGLVLRIGDAVIKCGSGVSRLEAWNQKHAYELIPSTVVRIPQIFHYFSRDSTGYIIMEYISGQILSSFEDPDIYLEPVAEVLRQFEQIQQEKPGPFHGKAAFGNFWLDYDPPILTTVADIEEYYNTRQFKKGPQKIELQGYPLIFCHLDIAPRNVVVLQNGSLCFIDWTTGGFYPRLFERMALQMNRRPELDWPVKLTALMDEMDENEKAQGWLLQRAAGLAVRHT